MKIKLAVGLGLVLLLIVIGAFAQQLTKNKSEACEKAGSYRDPPSILDDEGNFDPEKNNKYHLTISGNLEIDKASGLWNVSWPGGGVTSGNGFPVNENTDYKDDTTFRTGDCVTIVVYTDLVEMKKSITSAAHQ